MIGKSDWSGVFLFWMTVLLFFPIQLFAFNPAHELQIFPRDRANIFDLIGIHTSPNSILAIMATAKFGSLSTKQFEVSSGLSLPMQW